MTMIDTADPRSLARRGTDGASVRRQLIASGALRPIDPDALTPVVLPRGARVLRLDAYAKAVAAIRIARALGGVSEVQSYVPERELARHFGEQPDEPGPMTRHGRIQSRVQAEVQATRRAFGELAAEQGRR